MSAFKKATKEKAKLRAALIGPSGSGKSWTGLTILSNLCSKVAAIDTERHSLSKYAGVFNFDVADLGPPYSLQRYIEMIRMAGDEGYEGLLIDSLTHAWAGQGGALEQVDNAQVRGGNKFAAWRDVTPLHNKLIDAMLAFPGHLIVTMRAKTEWVQEKDERGKTQIRKVGLAPIQREGMEYEFDLVADMDQDHRMIVSKTRNIQRLDGQVVVKPGKDVADILREWLSDGAELVTKPAEVVSFEKPKVSEPSNAEKLEISLREATSVEALTAVASRAKILHDAKQISDEERAGLLAIYKSRFSELASKVGA